MKMIERLYGLYELMNLATKRAAAVEAYIFVSNNVDCSLPQNEYLEMSYGALVESALLNCAALFDRAKYGKENNCSFKQIIYYCKKLEGKEKERYNSFVSRLEKLCSDFDSAFPSRIRNKLLAHKDLHELFRQEIKTIKISGIKEVLVKGYSIISEMFEVTVGAHPKPFDFDEIVEKYKKSLLSIADCANNNLEREVTI